MNIIRLLLFLLLIWIVWSFFKRKNALKIEQSTEQPDVKQGTMIACNYCGLHIPAEEAIRVGDVNFCCKEHSKL